MRKILYVLLVLLFACSYDAVEFNELSSVSITYENKYIQIEPDLVKPQTCFVFYPGGLVEPESYINPLQKLGELGYRVIILKATADLAIFNKKRASKVIDDFNDIDNWIMEDIL